MRYLLAALLLTGLAASAPAAEAERESALDKSTLETFVRHLFLWGPQIKVTISDPEPSDLPGFVSVKVRGASAGASQEEVFYVTEDGQKILRAAVFDIDKNPFYKDLAKLKTEFQPSLGTPGAPVVLVVFSDFQCNYCGKEAQMLRENLLKTYPEQVRLYFKDFPLEKIHPWAKTAAIAGRCVFRQAPAAFWDFHDWVFAHQAEITPANLKSKVGEFAAANGNLDVLQLGRCIDTRETEAEINTSIAEARQLQVNATPTLFVNGRRVAAQLPWQNLKLIIDFEIEYQKTANNAGEVPCCELKLPTPLSQ